MFRNKGMDKYFSKKTNNSHLALQEFPLPLQHNIMRSRLACKQWSVFVKSIWLINPCPNPWWGQIHTYKILLRLIITLNSGSWTLWSIHVRVVNSTHLPFRHVQVPHGSQSTQRCGSGDRPQSHVLPTDGQPPHSTGSWMEKCWATHSQLWSTPLHSQSRPLWRYKATTYVGQRMPWVLTPSWRKYQMVSDYTPHTIHTTTLW